MYRIWLLAAFLTLAGCSDPVASVRCRDFDTLKRAAGRNLGIDWFLTDVTSNITTERIMAQRDQIEKMRKWAAGLSDYCERSAYISELDLVSWMTDGAENEMKTHRHSDDWAEWKKKNAAERQHLNEVNSQITKPR